MSDRCSVCGQAAIELGDSVPTASVVIVEAPMLGETSSFCRKCGTMSQGEAEFCRKCGNRTGDPPAFNASESILPSQTVTPPMQIQAPKQIQVPPTTQQQVQPTYDEITPAEQRSVINLCIPICITRFIYSAIWAYIVYAQIQWDYPFWEYIWNIIGTIISIILAIGLVGILRDSNFNSFIIHRSINNNLSYSGLCIVWYLIQLIFMEGAGILLTLIILDIVIIVISYVARSRLPKEKTSAERK